MKPTSKYERQRTFVEMLQSRIDLRANEIAYDGRFKDGADPSVVAQQVWDKRLLGYIIDLHRHLKLLHSVADRVWQAEYDANVKAQRESEG